MIMEWHYAHDADITIGEKHISHTARVLLITLVCMLCTIGGVAFYFRYYIYDYIADPDLILTNDSVKLEIDSKFDPKTYIANPDAVPYEIIGAELVDTSTKGRKVDKVTKLVSRYEVRYVAHNRVRSHEKKLIVDVVDEQAPQIELDTEVVILKRGTETFYFNPLSYIKKITDNYTDPQKVKLEYTDKFNFREDTQQCVYTVTDEAGNSFSKILNIAVVNSDAEKQQKEEEQKQKEQEQQAQQPSGNNPTSAPKPTSKPKPKATATPKPKATATSKPKATATPKPANDDNNDPTPTPKPKATATPKPTAKPTSKPKAYINGVHNISVPKGTSQQTIMTKLMKGVSGSGSVWLDCSEVNTTKAGTYKVYFESDDGVKKTATVTITDDE